MGLRSRLFVFVILPIALVVGLYGVLRIRQEAAEVVEAEKRHSAATARAVQIAVENALRDRQLADIQRLVGELVLNHPQIDRIAVVDGRLGLVAAEPARPGGTLGLEHLARVMADGKPQPDVAAAGVARYSLPLHGSRGAVEGAVDIVFATTRVEGLLGRTARDVGLRLGGLVLILTVLTTLGMRRHVIRPLGRLLASIRALGEGRPGPRLPETRRDELGMVAEAFNRMVDQLAEARARLLAESEHALELETQLRRAQTLAVAGKLTSALAHEVGTPLSIISGRAEIGLRALPPGHPSRADLETIVQQTERISGIIRTLLDSIRGLKPEVQPVDLAALLPQLASLVGHDARRRGIAVGSDVPPGLPPVAVDPGQIQQVVLNLLVNALDATPAGGRIRLAARAEADGGRAGVAITVADTGPGVPPELADRIFEPFVTTKAPGHGTGLGLSISRDIVREHGGRLGLAPGQAGAGAAFTVWLPAAEVP
jgi:signal transduction histidine kinase